MLHKNYHIELTTKQYKTLLTTLNAFIKRWEHKFQLKKYGTREKSIKYGRRLELFNLAMAQPVANNIEATTSEEWDTIVADFHSCVPQNALNKVYTDAWDPKRKFQLRLEVYIQLKELATLT